MLTDGRPSAYSHVTEQTHVKRSYDGIVAHESDVLLCERARQWVGSYQVGDNVSYCREPRAGEHGLQWRVGSRLIGFETDKNSLGGYTTTHVRLFAILYPYALPLTAYVHAHQRRHNKVSLTNVPRWMFRRLFKPSPNCRGCSRRRNVRANTHVDCRETKMWTKQQKELRALLPITASSQASSLRPDDEAREQLTRSLKQARTTSTGVETLQDVSFLFKKGIVNICEMDFFKSE